MKRKKSLKHSIAYQLFLDHGEPSSMPLYNYKVFHWNWLLARECLLMVDGISM